MSWLWFFRNWNPSQASFSLVARDLIFMLPEWFCSWWVLYLQRSRSLMGQLGRTAHNFRSRIWHRGKPKTVMEVQSRDHFKKCHPVLEVAWQRTTGKENTFTPPSLFMFYMYLFCVWMCVSAGMRMPRSMCGGQRRSSRSQFWRPHSAITSVRQAPSPDEPPVSLKWYFDLIGLFLRRAEMVRKPFRKTT